MRTVFFPDPLQIILLRIFRVTGIQFSQNTNIFPDLFYCNTKQFFHIRTDVICLIGSGIQHQENIIHIHRQLLKQLIPIQDLAILFLKVYPAFLNDQADQEGGDTEHDHTGKEHRAKLQAVHTGIDDIRLYKP